MQKTLLLAVAMLAANVQAQTCNPNMLASTPDNRFTVNNDGTVTDVRTNLTWKRCLEGQSGTDCSSGSPTAFTWQTALQHAAAQGNGWRLPNTKELTSLVELRCIDPAINLHIFPNTPTLGSVVWSGSPVADDSDRAWGLNLGDGQNGYFPRDRSNDTYVRLVRGGQ